MILIHQQPQHSEDDQGQDVEQALINGVCADKTEDRDTGKDDVLGQLRQLDPDIESGFGDDVEQDIAHNEPAENPVDQMGMLVEDCRAGGDPLDHEGSHENGRHVISWNSQGQHGNYGGTGGGVVCGLGSSPWCRPAGTLQAGTTTRLPWESKRCRP